MTRTPAALRGCQLKMRRAQSHFDALKREMVRFNKRQPYRLLGEFQPNTGKYVFRIKLNRDPALRWGILTGEIVQQFRSTLDHLVYALACLTRIDPAKTGFPIFLNERRSPGVDRAYFPDGQQLIRYVPGPCKPFFELYQPYQRTDWPEYHILEAIRLLSNEDKHELVPVAAAGVFAAGIFPGRERGVGLEPRHDIARVVDFKVHLGKPLKDGDEVAYAIIEPSGPQPQLKLHGEFVFFISLSHPKPELHERDVFALLSAGGQYIADIVATFEPAFGGSPPVLVGRP